MIFGPGARLLQTLLVAALVSSSAVTDVRACTRAVYHGLDGLVVTGRSMDWKEDIPANLWIFPRGLERHGAVGPDSVVWKSRHGSIVTSSFDVASVDGLNEKGLVANLLWLAEAKYPEFRPGMKGLSAAAWTQYVLDNFATVAEAVEALRREEFVVVSAEIPGTDRFATLHLSISDAGGDSAIFEYIDGRLVIHHGRAHRVMTNSPVFDQQLALASYWREIGGTTMLPGTNRAADRFVRASFYIDAIPRTADPRVAVAGVFSVMRNVSVPYGISSEHEPNISSTRWRTIADQANLRYFFETALTPNAFWVDLRLADLSEGAPVRKLSVERHEVYAGDALPEFRPAAPFAFAGL